MKPNTHLDHDRGCNERWGYVQCELGREHRALHPAPFLLSSARANLVDDPLFLMQVYVRDDVSRVNPSPEEPRNCIVHGVYVPSRGEA